MFPTGNGLTLTGSDPMPPEIDSPIRKHLASYLLSHVLLMTSSV